MDTSSKEITKEFPPFFRVYKDGHIERYMVPEEVPPTGDPTSGVQSKDILISPDTPLKARVFLSKTNGPDQKLPILIHYHGGGFCIGSSLDHIAHNFLTSLAAKTPLIAISVDYRLAPEHPLPIAYDDSWTALQWILSHQTGSGPDPWITQHGDFGRVFLAGESAGANIAHNVAVRAGVNGTGRVKGVMVVHPFFVGSEPDEMIKYLYPTSGELVDDPKMNPGADPDLAKMGCERVLVCVAGKDWLKPRGLGYCESLKKSGWGGSVELMETEDEDHCFHLFNSTSDKALPLMEKLVSFINQD